MKNSNSISHVQLLPNSLTKTCALIAVAFGLGVLPVALNSVSAFTAPESAQDRANAAMPAAIKMAVAQPSYNALNYRADPSYQPVAASNSNARQTRPAPARAKPAQNPDPEPQSTLGESPDDRPGFSNIYVGKKVITAAEQESLYNSLRNNGSRSMSPQDTATQARRMLIRREVLVQDAESKKLDQTKEIKDRIAASKAEILAKASIDAYLAKNPISEDEVKDIYDRNKAEYGDTEYQIRNILVRDRDQAERVLAELKSGADFEKMVSIASQDSQSAKNGGLNAYLSPAALSSEIKMAIMTLKPGEIYMKPIFSSHGYQIIKLENTRATEAFPTYEQAMPRIFESLAIERSLKHTEDLIQKATIK